MATKLAFHLLNKKGLAVLQYLINTEKFKKFNIVIISSRDSGNYDDCYDEIKNFSKKNNIDFFDRREEYEKDFDFSFAIGWKWLIHEIRDLVVIHDSLLPRYRGFAPLVNMLINGEKYIGASAIFANSEMDKGDIIFQEKVKIKYPIKINEAIEILSKIYVNLIDKLLKKILIGEKIQAFPQIENHATYSIWRDKEDYRINWNNKAFEIKRFIDAVGYPYEGAITLTSKKQTIKILDCEVIQLKSEILAPGKLLMFKDGKPLILCGENALILNSIEDQFGKPFQFNNLRVRLE